MSFGKISMGILSAARTAKIKRLTVKIIVVIGLFSADETKDIANQLKSLRKGAILFCAIT
ncbi:hypothetical protein GCM10023231_41620 [Olivibacter ginsenosidimutans]|uniref:Uncharacterized protein n=1 Tax=Olivibacter ginsenosidimutans TaxID=1176537 RepID=A0ABP9CD32_9SPHI